MRKDVFTLAPASLVDIDKDELVKLASAIKDIEKIAEQSLREKPLEPGYSRVIINALGAGEYYSFNKRGDYFPEDHLNPNPPKWNMEYGYKTYEKKGAVYWKHKRNPLYQLGKVAMALWHEPTKRVFVLADIDKVAASEYIEQLKKGHPVPTSMGTSVAFDACSICAPEKAFLDSMHPAEVKRLVKEGKIQGIRFKPNEVPCPHIPHMATMFSPDANDYIYMINFYPVFHDISIVDSPADELSSALKKVASTLDPEHFDTEELTYMTNKRNIEWLSNLVRKRLIPNSVDRADLGLIAKFANIFGPSNFIKIAANLKIPLTFSEWRLLKQGQHVIKKAGTLFSPRFALNVFFFKRSADPQTLELRMKKYAMTSFPRYNKVAKEDNDYLAYMLSILKDPTVDVARMPPNIRKVASFAVEKPETVNDQRLLKLVSKFYVALVAGVENV